MGQDDKLWVDGLNIDVKERILEWSNQNIIKGNKFMKVYNR